MDDAPVCHTDHDTCVSRVPVFSRLDATQQAVVGSYARPTHLAAGDSLHQAGDPAARLYALHTGQIKLVRPALTGREHLLRVAGPGDVIGEHAFLTGERPDYHAIALVDSVLCVFAHADLGRLVADYPAIALGLLRTLSEQLADAERRIALSGTDLSVRIASYLLDLPVEHRDGTYRVRLPLSKKDTASYLATTPESFSRALARLQRRGLITVHADVIEFSDPDGLEDAASGLTDSSR